MKKIYIIYLCFCTVLLYAQDKPLRFIELGIDVDTAFANSFIHVNDVFNKERTLALDLNKLAQNDISFTAQAKAGFFFNVNINSGFSVGLNAQVKVDSLGTLPRTLLSLLAVGNVDNPYIYSDTMKLNANVFADLGLSVYKRFKKLKITVQPALFVPLIYMPEPSVLYSIDTKDGIKADVKARADLYTPIPIESLIDGGTLDLSGSLDALLESYGVDISFNAEYELNPYLYLGASIVNLPLRPATLNHRTRYDISFNLENYNLLDSLIDNTLIDQIDDAISNISVEPKYNSDAFYQMIRPMRLDFYTISRPFRNNLWGLAIKVNMGFSVFSSYSSETQSVLTRRLERPQSYYYFNLGLGAYIHLWKILTVSAEMSHQEQVWKHRVGIALNLHFFEIDLALSLQSIAPATKEGFLESIKVSQAKGMGLTIGVRLGY